MVTDGDGAMTEAGKRRRSARGRPPKNPELGKRINVMFRLNEARRDQLMQDAEHKTAAH